MSKNSGVSGVIYFNAKKFMNSAVLIGESGKSDPYFVNLAFAIELFIKSMHVTIDSDTGKYEVHARTRGHSLVGIFEKLPQDVKKKAIDLYNNEYGESLSLHLAQISDVFIEWRYSHESNTKLNVQVLEQVAEFFEGFVKYVLNN